MQYQLETFTEGRQTAWVYQPYTGELLQDGRREERGVERGGRKGKRWWVRKKEREESEGKGEGESLLSRLDILYTSSRPTD